MGLVMLFHYLTILVLSTYYGVRRTYYTISIHSILGSRMTKVSLLIA
jgi:hypothetical protein